MTERCPYFTYVRRTLYKHPGTIYELESTASLSTRPGKTLLMNKNEKLIDKIHSLEKQVERYRWLVEDSPSLICAFLPDSTLTFVNTAYAQFFQKPPEALVSRKFLELIPEEEDHRAILEKFNSLTPETPTVTYEHRVFAPDGTRRWQRWTDRGFFDGQGRALYFQATGEDITESHHYRERLALFGAAIEAAAEAVFLTDRNGVIMWVNPAFTVLTGYSMEEATGRTPGELLKSGLQEDAFYKELWETILSGRTWRAEIVNRRKDGGLYRAEQTVTPVRAQSGEITHFVAILHDLTERLRILDALRDSEERFRSLVEGARDAVFSLCTQGNFTSINPAGERLTGRTLDQLKGRDFLGVLHPEDHSRAFTLFERSIRGELPSAFEVRVVDADGENIPIECVVTPQRRDDRIVGVMGIARDIRDRRSLEEQLRQLQKLDSIGRLTAGIAHDFNNILTVQEGYLSLLTEDPELPERFQEPLREMAEATSRATRLTRQLLMFSRKQVMQARPLDLGQIVQDLSNMMRRIIGDNIALEIGCPERLPTVRADPGMMEQAIVNLVVNARDAMPEGGCLTIALKTVSLEDTNTRNNPEARPGDFLCLTVADTGSGISPENMAYLFEPFFTTKANDKGTGLGLATTYGIVKQHEGWIDVESQLQQGTTVRIHLPVAPSDQPPSGVKTAAPSEPLRGSGTILVVEDDASVLELVRLILARQGYRVLLAESGAAALEVWRDHGTSIDLLLTDLIMPDGISGSDLAKRLIADKPALKVIFTSGYSTPELSASARELGDEIKFLQKPCSREKLLEAVRETLESDRR